MKQVHIVHFISSLQRGGAETILMQLVAGLQNEYRHTVIYLHDGLYRDELQQRGIALYHLCARGSYLNPWLWFRCYSLLKQLKPDLLHTSLWAANLMGRLVGRLLRIQTIASLHALVEHEGGVRLFIDRCTAVRSVPAIATSHTIARSMVSARKYREEDMTIIPSGVDREEIMHKASLHPCTYRKESNTFVIGAVGRLIPVKRYGLLIEAYADLYVHFPHIRLLLIGAGPEEASLRAQIATHGLTDVVTLITNVVAAPYYQFFDAFVLPSVAEGLGLVTLEAQLFSVPVIVAEQYGAHEIVCHNENGLCIPPDRKDLLSAALQQLIIDSALRVRLGAAGRVTVTHLFSQQEMLARYRSSFNQVTMKCT